MLIRKKMGIFILICRADLLPLQKLNTNLMELFENVKKGDKFVTINRKVAEYMQEIDEYHILKIDEFMFMVDNEGASHINREYDILKKGE